MLSRPVRAHLPLELLCESVQELIPDILDIIYISKTTTSLAFEFCLFAVFDFIMQLLLILNKLTCLLLFTLISFTFTLYFWDFWDLTS